MTFLYLIYELFVNGGPGRHMHARTYDFVSKSFTL
jgi:hypothetical protein